MPFGRDVFVPLGESRKKYSCMPNIKNVIDARNKTIIDRQHEPLPTPCNCRNKELCPLNGQCREEGIIYQAAVRSQDTGDTHTYTGICATEFKTRYNNHNSSFSHPHKRNTTELSKHIWALKDQNIAFDIKWKILKRAKPYNNATKRCNLCLHEKFYLMFKPSDASLNKRSELMSTCRHASKFLLHSRRTHTKFKPRAGTHE